MQENPMQGMWGRYAVFIVLSIGVLALNAYLVSVFAPPKVPPADDAPKVAKADAKGAGKAGPAAIGPADAAGAKKKDEGQPDAKKEPGKPDAAKPAAEAPKAAAAEPKVPDRWVTLGSVDPDSPYRMRVDLTNRGAGVRRIELSSPRYRELDNRSGYLGNVVVDEGVRGSGCPVQVVGRGTPAEEAGLLPGDVIKAVGDAPVTGFVSLSAALHKTKPRQTVRLKIARNGQEMALQATLSRRPLEVIRPEDAAPPSFLVGLAQIDGQSLAKPEEAHGEKAAKPADADFDRELDGARLRNVNWEVVSDDESHVTFRRALPQWDLEVLKTFRLAKVTPEEAKNPDAPAYHLAFNIEFRNTGKAARKLVYYVDGPNSLPTEGWWYASKVGRDWGAAGLRDVSISFQGDTHTISAIAIGQGKSEPLQRAEPISYVGVDAQYFDVLMIPQRPDPSEVWFSQWQPLHYGAVATDVPQLTNTSFRVTSTVR